MAYTIGTHLQVIAAQYEQVVVVPLTNTTAVLVYKDNTQQIGAFPVSNVLARVATLNGLDITLGPEHDLSAIWGLPFQNTDACKVSSNKIAIALFSTQSSNPFHGHLGVVTVSGTTLTVGPLGPDLAVWGIGKPRLAFLQTDKIILGHTPGGAVLRVCTITGDTIVAEAPTTVNGNASDEPDLVVLDSSHVVMIARQTRWNSFTQFARAATITGTSISLGNISFWEIANLGAESTAIGKLDSIHAGVFYKDNNNSNYGTSKVITVTGNSIAFGAKQVFQSGTITNPVAVVNPKQSGMLGGYISSDSRGIIREATLAGTLTSWDNEVAVHVGATSYLSIGHLTDQLGLCMYTDTLDGDVKVVAFASAISAPSIQVSGNMFIKGPTQAASQANLFLKTTALYTGLLQSENAIFYIPCDQLPAKEIVKNRIWTDQGGWFGAPIPSVRLQSGIVSSGLAQTNALAGFTLTDSSAPYKDITGSSGLCLAIWNLGSLSSDAFVILAGFGNTLTSTPDNGIKINMDPGRLSVGLYASGQTSPDNFIPTTVSDPIFFVVDIRFSGGTTWLVRRSINGSNWSSPAILNFGFHFDNSAFAKFAFLNSSSVNSSVDEVILWSNNTLFTPQEISNLFSLGNTLIEPMTAYAANFAPKSVSGSTSLIIKVASAIDNGPSGESLFIGGSGIIGASWDISFFINGIEPRLSLLCPPLDPTASIQIKDSLIKIYQSRIDALINQLGKNVTLEFDPILTPCPNCIFDRIRKRSTGIFIPGGPRPFKKGRKCPWCKGRGLLETSVTKCIKCLIKWNPEDAENFGISIEQKNGVVRFKTFLTEADDLIRAKTAVSNKDIEDQLELRVRLLKGPIPVGLRERRYCISFWELI